MERHIKPHDNQNQPIIDIDNPLVPNTFFNDVKLKKNQTFSYCLEAYESVIVILVGESRRSLLQYFHPDHEYQVHTIPGIKDMIANYK
jgi:hypothetical protein